MKRIVLALLALCLFQTINAQVKDTAALYVKNPIIPPFKIYKVPDSTQFTKEDIKKDRPVLVMYFSPDCEHCQHETKELLAYKEELKDVEILMVSAMPYDHIKTFYFEYGLNKLPNFTLGQDRAYFLGTFYKPKSYPSMFLYDRHGNFINNFSGNVAIPEIVEAFK